MALCGVPVEGRSGASSLSPVELFCMLTLLLVNDVPVHPSCVLQSDTDCLQLFLLLQLLLL